MDEASQKLQGLEQELNSLEKNPQPTIPSPETPPVPPDINKGKSKKVLWLAIGFFILSLVIAGAYFLGRKGSLVQKVASIPTPSPILITPTPSPTADPIVDWETYINTQYGFSIKHPKELVESIEISNDGSFGKQIFFNISKTKPEDCKGGCPIIEKSEKILIANLAATKLEGYKGEIGGCGPQKYLSYVFEKNSDFIVFTLNAAGCEELRTPQATIVQIDEEEINLFDQILSTFQFTE